MYILDAKRTPIGKYLGTLRSLSAIELTDTILKYFLKKYPFLKNKTNGVIIGNVLSAGLGMNPARITSINAGISYKSYALTINHVCGSGLSSIITAYNNLIHNDEDIIIAGGMESMSRAPYLVYKNDKGSFDSQSEPIASFRNDGLFCSLTNQYMGQTAERIAKKYKIPREEQDRYADYSHKKAALAQNEGYFKDQIIPIHITKDGSQHNIQDDEQIRKNSSLLSLSKLKPIFDANGTVTAGNASSINDGASLVILVSDKIYKTHNIKPLAKIVGYNYMGLEPDYMGIGSYYSIKALLKRYGLTTKDIDLYEINEAFAASSIAVINLLKLNQNKVNVTGGAIALGHPLGASGARILTTLIYNLKRLKKRRGIASLCIGGGQGVSILIENI